MFNTNSYLKYKRFQPNLQILIDCDHGVVHGSFYKNLKLTLVNSQGYKDI